MNEVFTRAFKDVIFEFGLIDTGNLLASINVSAELFGWELVISIECEDYVKYHLEMGLVDAFTSKSEVNEEIGKIYQARIETMMENILNGIVDEEPRIDVTILINGE